MHVGGLRQSRRIDLNHGAEEHKMYLGSHPRKLRNQLHIQPLIEHTEESCTRMRDSSLICRILTCRASLLKMCRLDRTRKGMHIRMMRSLCLVDRLATGKDDVSSLKQLAFLFNQLSRRAKERRQLIHAVVYRHACRGM